MLRGYIETALWSTNDESTPSGGVPLDENYSAENIAPETLATMRKDCEAFIKKCGPFLIEQFVEHAKPKDFDTSGYFGYLFWLSRNGHGTGFFDRDDLNVDLYGFTNSAGSAVLCLAEILDDLCGWQTEFSEVNLYVGDDGKIYDT